MDGDHYQPSKLYFKTNQCRLHKKHDFAQCRFWHPECDDQHIYCPWIERSVPWSPQVQALVRQHYDRLREHQEAERRAEFKAQARERGELKAVRCRLDIEHDFRDCRFYHSWWDPMTCTQQTDRDPDAQARRQQRLAREAEERRVRDLSKHKATHFPKLQQTPKNGTG